MPDRFRLALLILAALAAMPALAQDREAVRLDFPGEPDSAVAARLKSAGIAFGAYLGGSSYHASVPMGALADLQAIAGESGVTLSAPTAEEKLQAMTGGAGRLEGLDPSVPDGSMTVVLVPAAGAGDEAVRAALEALPVEVIDANERRGWVVTLPREALTSLAAEPIVDSLYAAPADGTLN